MYVGQCCGACAAVCASKKFYVATSLGTSSHSYDEGTAPPLRCSSNTGKTVARTSTRIKRHCPDSHSPSNPPRHLRCHVGRRFFAVLVALRQRRHDAAVVIQKVGCGLAFGFGRTHVCITSTLNCMLTCNPNKSQTRVPAFRSVGARC